MSAQLYHDAVGSGERDPAMQKSNF